MCRKILNVLCFGYENLKGLSSFNFLATNKFERILDESNCASRRMGHTAIYDKKLNLVYIFGGSKNKKWYSDINTFDTKTKKWVTVEVKDIKNF